MKKINLFLFLILSITYSCSENDEVNSCNETGTMIKSEMINSKEKLESHFNYDNPNFVTVSMENDRVYIIEIIALLKKFKVFEKDCLDNDQFVISETDRFIESYQFRLDNWNNNEQSSPLDDRYTSINIDKEIREETFDFVFNRIDE